MRATRYVALVGAGAAIERLAGRIERCGAFSDVYRRDGLIVLAGHGAECVGLGGRGTIVGTLFSREDAPRRVVALNPERCAKIEASAGAALIADYWGGYVGFIPGRSEGEWEVVRDPSGAMPCYYAQAERVLIFASDVAAIMECGAWAPRLDWSYLAHHLRAGEGRGARTGFTGLLELLAGTSMSCRRDGRRLRTCWSPWDHVTRRDDRSDDEVDGALRATVSGCVRAWATCFDKVLVGVSGGLDSSIVAACLAERPGLSLYTLATRDPDGDERPYAYRLAEALGAPLAERFYRREDVHLGRSNAGHLPRPVGLPWLQASERVAREVAAQVGAGAIFDGNGGDNVFCLLQSVAPVIDRVLAEGPGRGAWQTVADVCRMNRASVPTVLKRTLRTLLARSAGYRCRLDPRFLSADVRTVAADAHPWLSARSDALPGKTWHVAMICAVQDYLDGLARGAGPVALSPLMSQPIVELCLRIQTWRWCAGGVNRAVARRAFAGVLPPEIVMRSSKGGPDGFLIEIFEARRAELRALLLDGLLAQQGILDKAATEAALDDEGLQRGSDYIRLLAIADTEAWARGWSAQSRSTSG